MIRIIHPDNLYYGQIRYFESSRCLNTEQIKRYNHNLITCEEIVSYDCGLLEMCEMASLEREVSSFAEQILAVIMRPGREPNYELSQKPGFVFCGYDLVEEFSSISAITNCGGSFESIYYDRLTEYGLIATYKEAVLTQLALAEEAPNDAHADCEIVEIWRKLI